MTLSEKSWSQRQAECDSAHALSLGESCSQSQKVNGGGQGLGSGCSTGTEGQSGKMGGSGGDAGVDCTGV